MAGEERKNILVVTLSNIGDVILTTPVIGSLKALFPSARFTVVVGPRAAELLRGSRLIDRLLIYDKRWALAEKLRLIRALREEFYDYVVDLRNSALPYLVRADRRSPVFRSHQAVPARDYHLEVLHMMRLSPPPPVPFDFFSAAEEHSLGEKLARDGGGETEEWIVVAPSAASEAKRWPVGKFKELLAKLLDASSGKAAVVGDAGEEPLGRELSSVNPRRVINLSGRISLRELAALLSRARLVVANDSACMHLAYELGRPVAALFGPSNPVRYGREGKIWKILRESPPLTLQDLSCQKVFEACESLLNGTAVGARR